MSSRKPQIEMTLQPGWNWREMLDRFTIKALALDHRKPWKIVAYQDVRSRSGEANAYYNGIVLAQMSEVSGYEKEELHTELCMLYFGRATRTIMGRTHEVPLRTTTTNEAGEREVLGRGDFADFVDFAIRMAAEHFDLAIPPPTTEQVPR